MSKKIIPLFLFVVFLSFLINDKQTAFAIKQIPDGGARITDGWTGNEKIVDSRVKQMWERNQIPRGGKNQFSFFPESGRNLIYDVYAGSTSQAKKRGFTVTPSNNYITFDGWAIIHGHHHHAEMNQATYIGLVNKDNRNERLIYKTAMRANTTANNDIWDGKFGKCPSTAFNRPTVYGKTGACNMDYNFTQFRAYIDMREVFGEGNEDKEWLMYIIKRVEDQIIYDELILPFDTEVFTWRQGEVTMQSGQDARNLRMVAVDVIKRASVGGSGPSGNQRYFAPFEVYRTNGLDESNSSHVAVQYRVYDNISATVSGRNYVATNSNRWAASTFWEFGGSIATLSYKRKSFDVNITEKYVDKSTGRTIKQNTKTVRYEGKDIVKNYAFQDIPNYHFLESGWQRDNEEIRFINESRTKQVTVDGKGKHYTVYWWVGEKPANPCEGGGCEDESLTCPPPNRPDDLNRPFEYKMDLVTEQIEGETVEKGTQTHTPVRVFRADYSDYRQAIKDRLNEAIKDNENKKANCQSIIEKMETNLLNLQKKQQEMQASLSACQSDPNKDCSNIASGLLQVRDAINKQQSAISTAKSELLLYDQINEEIRDYLQDIADKEKKYEVINTHVELSFKEANGSGSHIVERKPVSLREGEQKLLNFYWILQNDGIIKAFIDPDDEFEETDEMNNIKETLIYISSFDMGACVAYGQTSKTQGIVRTITNESGTQILREYVEGKLVRQSRDSMRAGFGFSYEAEMRYYSEDPKLNAYGIQYTESYFDHLADHLRYDEGEHGYIVAMDATYDNATAPPRRHEQTWSLPEVMVEEKSGNVFEKDYHRNPNHNPSETMLDGGRKWYTPWMQKDGVYDYKVMGYEAGANKLGVCMDGQYEVFGTFLGDPDGNDDFVRRTFSPNNPFPSGVGWNWKGNVDLLTSLQSWWNYPPDRDPRTAPNSFDECYVLDREAVKQVKAYNKRNGMEWESFLPNGGRFWSEVGPYIERCSRN